MTELSDAVTIINRALARIGAGAITATDEDTDLARQCMAIWDDLSQLALSLHPWAWSRRTFALETLAVDTLGWDKAFNFPTLALDKPYKLLDNPKQPDHPLKQFMIEGRTIYADVPLLWGQFPIRPDSRDWPAAFRTAFTMWLAAEFCVPVTHDDKMGASLRASAIGSPGEEFRGGLMGRLISQDAMASGGPAPVMASDPLTGARYGGAGPAAWHGDF